MIAFTVLAVQVVLWQNQDLSVDIISETQTGNQEVTISVRNTAGSTLLFYENAEMTGKIEYLSENGWIEYCDFSYTAGNAGAVSQLYGGTFAELDPGEDWDLTIPEDKVASMQSGTYRIRMTYITERNYNRYLENAYKNRNDESDSSSDAVTKPDRLPNKDNSDLIADISDINSDIASGDINVSELIASGAESDVIVTKDAEAFLAESESETFVKTFDIVIPEDIEQDISIVGRSVISDDMQVTEKSEPVVSNIK